MTVLRGPVVSLALLATLLALAASAAAASPRSTRFLVTVTPFTHGRLSQRGSVDVVARNGRVQRVVAPAGAPYPYDARWSPDDSMIAWASRDGIHLENANGSAQRLLVPASTSCKGSCTILQFIWSPDSRALAVGGAGAQTNGLLLVPIDGGAPKTLAPALSKSLYSPAFWTPDGASLVYGGTIGSRAEIRSAKLATGRRRTIYSTPNTQAPLPLFSPNLRYHVVIKDLSQYRRQLRIVDSSSGKTRVIANVNPTNFLGWSRDSRTLAVVESGWHVVTVSAESGRVRAIGRGLNVYWNRDGELLVIRGAYNQVWASSGGRPERLLFKSPQGQYVNTIDGD
jgi:Tol biopolymer transport system component